MKKKYIGIDIGGTTVKFAVIEEDGNVLKKWKIPTDTSDSGKNIIPDIEDAVEKNIDPTEISGIGVGVPGPVSRDGSTVIRAVNIGWGETPLGKELQKKFNVPVNLVNDANAAALGEMWQGAAAGKDNILFVTLGTGVGGGIIIDGHLVVGTHAAGGEIGHIPVYSKEHRVCGCGNINCLEAFGSANGLVTTMKRILAENKESRGEDFTTIDIFKWLADGDPLAKQAVAETVRYLGQALAAVINTVDIESVVIGGGLSGAGAALLDPLKEEIDKHVFPQIRGKYDFGKAKLGNDAGAFGDVYSLIK